MNYTYLSFYCLQYLKQLAYSGSLAIPFKLNRIEIDFRIWGRYTYAL